VPAMAAITEGTIQLIFSPELYFYHKTQSVMQAQF
jgi:hypothetical protein